MNRGLSLFAGLAMGWMSVGYFMAAAFGTPTPMAQLGYVPKTPETASTAGLAFAGLWYLLLTVGALRAGRRRSPK